MVDKARQRKMVLQDKIEALAAQNRLVMASAVGSHVNIDDSKLAQTEKLIGDIKKRLDVAERVLAHEGQFNQAIDVDVVNEKDLVGDVKAYFAPKTPASEAAVAAAPSGQ